MQARPGPVAGAAGIAGVSAASSDTSPSETFGAVAPDPVTSAGIGMVTASHQKGLQSGGMFGYSTFFTGYRPEDHHAGRRLSIGRAAAETVSLAAEGLRRTPLSGIDAVDEGLKRASKLSEYGMGVFGNIQSTGLQQFYGDPQGQGVGVVDEYAQQGRGGRSVKGSHRAASIFTTESRPQSGSSTPEPAPGAENPVDSYRQQAGQPSTPRPPAGGAPVRSADDVISEAAEQNADDTVDMIQNAEVTGTRGASRVGTAGSPDARMPTGSSKNSTLGRAFRFLVGGLGGAGYNADGSTAVRQVYDETLGGMVTVAEGGSEGATFMKSSAGRMIGSAFKFAGYAEAAQLAGQGISYAAGKGYESLVEATTRLQRRTGGAGEQMSTAYYNRAASTERQRAVQSMNSNKLNPRNQIMGNEAYFMHS